MRMPQPHVDVPMAVRFVLRVTRAMGVPMMFVVDVPVLVFG